MEARIIMFFDHSAARAALHQIIITGFFVVTLAAYITITLINPPVKIIHPDALRFTAIFQQQYDAVKSIRNVPKAVVHGLRRCNGYDWSRGRITNYLAFGVEALVRNHLPFPFISWLTMALLLMNAAILARILTKEVKANNDIKQILFCVTAFALTINPFFISGYMMQFIYPKYLCVTFMLFFVLFKRRLLRASAIAGAMFSDEIGLVFSMVAVFFIVFNSCMRVRHCYNFYKTKIAISLLSGLLSAFVILGLYFGILHLIFGQIPIVIKFGFASHLPMKIILRYAMYSIYNVSFLTIGNIGIIIFFTTLALGILKEIREYHHNYEMQKKNDSGHPLYLINRNLQIYAVAIFIVLFVVIVMYKGSISFFYYGYPISMLVAFVAFSSLIKCIRPKVVIIALSVIALSLFIRLPDTFRMIKTTCINDWLSNGSVNPEEFHKIEMAINEIRNSGHSQVFDVIDNGKDINWADYAYGKQYFPVSGIVKILIWPRKINHFVVTGQI
jgi:hypothetical protein